MSVIMFSFNDLMQVIIILLLLTCLTPFLGNYMAKVFTGQRHFMKPLLGWLEKLVYRFINIKQDDEANWKIYMFGMLTFNFLGFAALFLLQVLQRLLPLNPQSLPDVTWHSAFNTAVSFMTNTNWQAYAGETTLSYFVQMTGLTVQNFLSAATGITIMLALTRGIVRKTTDKIGSFWVDLTRATIYVLLPLSFVLAVLLSGQGVIQNFKHYETVQTLQGAKQVVPMGPAASQIAIKQLGTNGGGYFNANSAHPFENPTPFSNLLEMLSILLIPASLTYTYGKMTGSLRQGWTLYTVMFILLLAGLFFSLKSEYSSFPLFKNLMNMEGKETRFGITNSIVWSVFTTGASNGSVNAMHDSLSPIAGMIAMLNIMLGEIIFGGVGAGIYGILVFVVLTVFIAGLMVGRTPEYLGKKIEKIEIQMALIAVFATSLIIPLFSALALMSNAGLSGLNNSGPHGLSEILYAYSSAAGNNGSAFAGLNANTVFYNLTLGIVMLIGRFGIIIPVMVMAGSLAQKKVTPVSSGTFKTDNWLFIVLLIGVIIIIGGLTHFPSLALGPVMEHLLLKTGITF
jgi:K+-transporting ATPase ATPase A chain